MRQRQRDRGTETCSETEAEGQRHAETEAEGQADRGTDRQIIDRGRETGK